MRKHKPSLTVPLVEETRRQPFTLPPPSSLSSLFILFPSPAESAGAESDFGAPAADTAAVQYDLHVSHPVVTPEVQSSIDAFRKVSSTNSAGERSAAHRRYGKRRRRRRQSSSRPDGPIRDHDRRGEQRRDTRAFLPLAPSDRGPPAFVVSAPCSSFSLCFLPQSLESEALVQQHPAESARFLSDQNLHRYLRARQFDLKKAHKLIMETLAWRLAYEPESISAAQVESECKTGKIRVLQQLDRHSRPIIVMDPSRENSKNHDSQLRHLVWQLERAKRKMNVRPHAEGPAADEAQAKPAFVEKYCLFINMERNSIWNSPPLKTSMETLKTLTDRLPEHLGQKNKI